MAVTIQDVLDLLPQLFPGVQKIPYSNLHPNPDNPGAALSDQDIQDLADNLAERGLVNPLKVQPDPVNPLVGGVKPHSEDPKLTAEGRPWTLADFNYRLLAGERRYRAAGRLRWAELPAFILNPSPEEAVEITHLDNDVRDRGWWAGYQSIEQLVKANPNLAQSQVATKLKMDPTKVGKALRLLPLLDQDSRKLIIGNSDNSNKVIRGISESAVSRLADLGPGSALKPGVKKAGDDSQKLWPYPAIPTETLVLIRRTLTVAVDEQLTEAGVKALVAWVQEGHQPEDYGTKTAQVPTTPKPVGKASRVIDYSKIPVSRIRVNSLVTQTYLELDPTWLQRRALSMQATGESTDISVRRLSEEEKKTDPDHDYELFEGEDILKCAQMLGWPTLQAMVYDLNEEEGIRHRFVSIRHSTPYTWIETYIAFENMLADDPAQNISELAVELMEDPIEAAQLLPVMKLLNDNAQNLIVQNIRQCFEGRVDMGGWRFGKSAGIELKRLEKVSKNLAETQRLVERVVRVAVAEEERLAHLNGLIDWVLAGNEPEGYFEDEAVGHETKNQN